MDMNKTNLTSEPYKHLTTVLEAGQPASNQFAWPPHPFTNSPQINFQPLLVNNKAVANLGQQQHSAVHAVTTWFDSWEAFLACCPEQNPIRRVSDHPSSKYCRSSSPRSCPWHGLAVVVQLNGNALLQLIWSEWNTGRAGAGRPAARAGTGSPAARVGAGRPAARVGAGRPAARVGAARGVLQLGSAGPLRAAPRATMNDWEEPGASADSYRPITWRYGS